MLAGLENMSRDADASYAFPPALRDEFLARARPSHARNGQIILTEGMHSTDVYLIRSGKVQVSLFSEQGRETILRELGKDQIFGELAAIDQEPRSTTVIAREDTILAFVTGDEFLAYLAEIPAAGLWMARLFAVRVRNLTEKTFELSTMSVSSRLQSELLRQCIAAGIADDRSVIEKLPTHAELAARIGSHREAITRELGLLTSEGIVTQAGRKLTILSVSRLQALLHRTLG
jgi:CRP/FNR family transcriptional regulator, cyclic AMP receptor protein